MDPIIASLDDDELAERLKSYGVNVGPVVQSTRRLYERKLLQKMTGQPISPEFEEVPDDESEEEEESEEEGEDAPVIIPRINVMQTETRQRVQRRTPPRVSRHDDDEPTAFVSAKSSLTQAAAPKKASLTQAAAQKKNPQKKFPVGTVILVFIVLAVLGYFVITFMEPQALNRIPGPAGF